MENAAAYIRVSTEEQVEYSPDAQRRALEKYAREHQLQLSPEHIYIDAGLSGRRAETRPAFMSMIAAAKKKPPPFSVILVHKFDRFARNREDSVVYKSMLRRQCGVQVISITEHLEDDRVSLIMEAMLEAMAEYYSINLGDEVRKGMLEKARRGELQTVPAFGYTVRENRLEPLPQEAQVVRMLFRRFLEGASMHSLARWAKQAGILTHRGHFLDVRGIRYILSNPVYIGKLRWTPEGRTGQGTLVADSKHVPLVSPKTFQAVQEKLLENANRYGPHAKPSSERKHWLSGLLRCAACGGRLIFSKPHYFKCGRYAKGQCNVSQHVSAALMEQAVLDQLRRDSRLSGPMTVSLWGPSAAEPMVELELDAIQRKLMRLREAYLCGAEDLQSYQIEKAALEAQSTQLRQEITSGLQAEDQQTLLTRVQAALVSLEDHTAEVEAQYRAASQVLESCRWDKSSGRLEIIYRFSLSSPSI